MKGRKVNAWPAVVFLVNSAPRTVPEVAQLTGHCQQTVRRTINRLAAEGLVSAEPRYAPQTPRIWTWAGK